MIISERSAWRNLTLGQRFPSCFRVERITVEAICVSVYFIVEQFPRLRSQIRGASEFAERSTLRRANLVAHLYKGRRKHCSEKHSLVPREILERGPALWKIIPPTRPLPPPPTPEHAARSDSESESELSSPEDTGARNRVI